MTATAPRRISPPRSKAAPRSNGHSGGAAANDTPPRPPEKVPEPAHPYGDRKTFTWRVKDEPPIVLPHISTVNTTQEFFCKIYDLNEMFQSFEWMILAGVPKEIRVRVAKLGDDDPTDQANLFRSWFAPMTRPTGGEPPGES
jgi:hypothetical protein